MTMQLSTGYTAPDYSGLLSQVNQTLSPDWLAFEEQQAYQAQPDAGAAYDWTAPIPEYNYTPPAPTPQAPTLGANLGAVAGQQFLPPEIVSPQFVRSYDVSAPTSYEDVTQGSDLGAMFGREFEIAQAEAESARNAMPSSYQSIIGMDTPSDLALDPTTPFNRAAPLDPVGNALRAIYNGVDEFSNRLDQAPINPYLLPLTNALGVDQPTTGEGIDYARNEAIDAAGLYARRPMATGTGLTTGNEDIARSAADFVLPRSTLEAALEVGPGGTLMDLARLRSVPGALDELPQAAAAAALRNRLQSPGTGDTVLSRLSQGVVGASDEASSLPPAPASAIPPAAAAPEQGISIWDEAERILKSGDLPGTKAYLKAQGVDGVLPRHNRQWVQTFISQNKAAGSTPTPKPATEMVPMRDSIPERPIARPPEMPASGSGVATSPVAPEAAGLPSTRPAASSVATAPPPPTRAPVAVADKPSPDGFAGNIRLSKYPEDIRGTIKEWADANPDAVQDARRGVRSDAQVRADAEALVDEVGGNFSKIQKEWKPGEAWNAEEITAIRGALNTATENVLTLARAADSTENQLKLAEAILEQQRIQQVVHGVTAEAGRSLRAFRQQASMISGDVVRVQELLRSTLGTTEPKDFANLTNLIKAAADTGNPAAVNKLINAVNKPGWSDYLYELWINSILSGPMTHARNIIGNTAAAMSEPLRRGIAAGVDAPLSRIQGRAQERFWQEAPAAMIGMVQGIPEGVSGALKSMRYGFNPAALGQVEIRKTAIPGALGRTVRIPTAALESMDAFFSAVNSRMLMNANATRMARREGLTGSALQDRIASLLSNPPEQLTKQVFNQSEELLFRGDLGKSMRAFAQFRNNTPGMRYIVPFTRTPANLLKFGVQHSPLGALDYNMWRKLAQGNPEGADEISRVILGSSVAAGFGALVATGQIDITAGVPTNSAERDRFYREGKLPFSVKIPGLGWIQYNQIPVLDTSLTTLGGVVQGVRDGEDVDEIAIRAVTTIAQSIMDKSYMSGLSDLLDAVRDPERFAVRFASRNVSGFVPFSAALRQANNVMDNSVKDAEGFVENVKAGLPHFSQQVPTRLDAFGQEIERGNSPLSPIAVSAETQSAVDAELERLGLEVGFVGTTIGGKKLTREEQRTYQQLAGQMTLFALNSILSAESYQALPDLDKQKVMESMIDRSRSEMRKLLGSDAWAELAPDEKQQVIDTFIARFQR